MAFCTSCGSEVSGAKFCPNCGQPQGGTPLPAAQPQQTLPEAEEITVWEGTSKELSSLVSGGKLTKARYRLSNKALYFEQGMLSTTSQQVPLWAVRDLDVTQSLSQKMRGVGNITVHVEHSDYTGLAEIVLDSVEDPGTLRDKINQYAHRERLSYEQRRQTRYFGGPR